MGKSRLKQGIGNALATYRFTLTCRQLALLVGGDAAALLLFAGIGRRNHSEGLQLTGIVSTALPFLIGMCRFAPCCVGMGLYCSLLNSSVL